MGKNKAIYDLRFTIDAVPGEPPRASSVLHCNHERGQRRSADFSLLYRRFQSAFAVQPTPKRLPVRGKASNNYLLHPVHQENPSFKKKRREANEIRTRAKRLGLRWQSVAATPLSRADGGSAAANSNSTTLSAKATYKSVHREEELSSQLRTKSRTQASIVNPQS